MPLIGKSLERVGLNRVWTLEKVEDAVIEQNPHANLQRYGFQLARATKGRQLTTVDFQSVNDLNEKIGKSFFILFQTVRLCH